MILSTRTTPARSKAALKASLLPTIAPVCVLAALEASSERPAFNTTTGFIREAVRKPLIKLRASSTLSIYNKILSVLGSSAKKSNTSPKSTSAVSPKVTTLENPICRAAAQSKIAVHIPPDCETKAKLPGLAVLRLYVAFKPAAGRITPMQFGPIICTPYCWAISTISFCKRCPLIPASLKPDEIIIAPFTLCSPHC